MRHATRCAAAGAACLLLAGGPSLAPAGAATEAAQDYGQQAEQMTDTQRSKRDIAELRGSRCLHKYAAKQARRMARAERIWHQDLQRILRDCDMAFVGENVAAGFDSGRTVVNRGWMRSKDHRRNVLEEGFRRVEVVARQGDDGRWYAAQVFGRPG